MVLGEAKLQYNFKGTSSSYFKNLFLLNMCLANKMSIITVIIQQSLYALGLAEHWRKAQTMKSHTFVDLLSRH